MTIITKICSSCGLTLPIDKFPRHRGRQRCEDCYSKRTCGSCGRTLSIEEFPLSYASADGHQSLCKRCKRDGIVRWNHSDRGREWLKVYFEAYRSKRNGILTTFTILQWQRAIDYFGGRCAVCGRKPGIWRKLAQDHWIPVSLGGVYTKENIIPLCHGVDGCNNIKHSDYPHDWLVKLECDQSWRLWGRTAKEVEEKIAKFFAWQMLFDD